jgi:hypothetical protein
MYLSPLDANHIRGTSIAKLYEDSAGVTQFVRPEADACVPGRTPECH